MAGEGEVIAVVASARARPPADAMATVEPLLKPFETSAPPASYDALDATLRAFMAKTVPIESDGELRRRERVMGELKRLFQAWVRSVCKAKGLSDELASEAGGKLYTSGSYRLRVHKPGADIDSICVAPNHCTREDFFDTLKAMLLEHPQVENLRSVETAVVPIMTFDLDGVNIDLLFAHLPLNAIPASLDIDEDAWENAMYAMFGYLAFNNIYNFVPSCTGAPKPVVGGKIAPGDNFRDLRLLNL